MQCVHRDRPRVVQVAFNIGASALVIAAAYWMYHLTLLHKVGNTPLPLVAAASIYFVANTVPVALVISLTEHKPPRKIWSECYFWTFPYYLVGAGVAALVSRLNKIIGWETALAVLPVVYLIYRSYRLYLGKLEAEKYLAEQMAKLHLRTIEVLRWQSKPRTRPPTITSNGYASMPPR